MITPHRPLQFLSRIAPFGSLAALALGASGCGPKQGAPVAISTENRVTLGGLRGIRHIEGEALRYDVLDDATARARIAQSLRSGNAETAAPAATAPSLFVSMPRKALITQNWLFGGVVTAVSIGDDEDLGNLKLSDFPPVHVTAKVEPDATGGKSQLALRGCLNKCTAAAATSVVAKLPVVAADAAKDSVLLDLSAVTADMSLMKTVPGARGETSGRTLLSTSTVLVDFQANTLVFDVENRFAAKTPTPVFDPFSPPVIDGPRKMAPLSAADRRELRITSRWYLKLDSGFHQNFQPLPQTPGVGFFTTDRNADEKIIRQPIGANDSDKVHYFVKHVPVEHRLAFAQAFDAWNATFRSILGKELLSYEFVPENDPRNELLVPGDVRYHIVEWDLRNQATYGGLGPSIAHQLTGEIFSSNVLIQGPTIMDLYTKWYSASQEARELRRAGQPREAEALLHAAQMEIQARVARPASASAPKLDLRFGKHHFQVHAQRPELSDPKWSQLPFDEFPENLTFAQYMRGYFFDMLTHELGHNMGLRHNFRGNLGAKSVAGRETEPTRSVMEYLPRLFRYKDNIGEYDRMAIEYGYRGKAPAHLDWFCTDEDSAFLAWGALPMVGLYSGECSKDDATADPYGYLDQRLARGVDLLVGRGSKEAPTWKASEMLSLDSSDEKQLDAALKGLLVYANDSDIHYPLWTAFNARPGRPTDGNDVPAFVVGTIRARICDPTLTAEIAAKSTEEARKLAQDNLNALKKGVNSIAALWTGIGADAFDCAKPAPTELSPHAPKGMQAIHFNFPLDLPELAPPLVNPVPLIVPTIVAPSPVPGTN